MYQNPYIAGAVIKDRAKFIGRKDMINDVIASLDNQKKIVLYGQRRVGKSSILHQIEQELVSSVIYMPIYIDLQGKLNLPLDKQIKYIAQRINDQCKLERSLPKDLTSDPIVYFQNTWLTRVLSNLPKTYNNTGNEFQKSNLVLLLDEFDDSNQSALSMNATNFYEYVSQLLIKYFSLKIIVVLSRSPDSLSEPAKQTIKEANPIRVSLMTEEEIKTLTTLSEPHLKWTDQAQETLWRFTKGHPFLAQLFCTNIWERARSDPRDGNSQVTYEDMELVSQVGQISHFIDNDWNNLDPQERVLVCLLSSLTRKANLFDIWAIIEENNLEGFYVSADTIDKIKKEDDYLGIYRARKDDYLRELLDHLVDSDWIESSDWQHRWLQIKIPVFGQWVSSNYQLRYLVNDLFDKQKRADILFLKASHAESDEKRIDIMEKALAADSDNERYLLGLTEKLKEIIKICINGGNYPLAIKYGERLSKYNADLAKRYITQAENKWETRRILRRIDIDVTSYHFIDAYQQAYLLYAIDEGLTYSQIVGITIELIYYALRVITWGLIYWFHNALFLLPLAIIVLAFQTNVFNLESSVITDRNKYGMTIVVTLSIISTIVEKMRERSLDEWLEDFISIDWVLFCIANLFGVFYIIFPNLLKTSLPSSVELILFILPLLTLPLYWFKKTEIFNSLIMLTLISLFSYGVCYLGWTDVIVDWDKGFRHLYKAISDFFIELNKSAK